MSGPWLLVLLFLAYLFGPSRAEAPPDQTRSLVAEAILEGGGFDLGRVTPSGTGPEGSLRMTDGRLLAQGPLLPALASLPFAAALHAVYPNLDVSDRARWTGRLAGAFWTAAAVAVTFVVLRRFTGSTRTGVLLALAAGFASPLWSTASRSDAQPALAALAVALVLDLGLGRLPRDPGWREIASAALLAALIFLDTPSLLAPVVLLVVLQPRAQRGRRLLLCALGAMGAAVALCGLQVLGTGRLLPLSAARFGSPDAGVFLAYLASPGKGIVWFAPIVLPALGALLGGHSPRGLLRGLGLVWLILLVEVSCARDPWGAHAFGPGLLASFVPILTVIAAPLPRPWTLAGALVCVPAALAHAGAVFLGGHTWDERRQVVLHPEAVWDLRDSPFVDLVLGAPRPDLATLRPGLYAMGGGEHPTRAGHESPWLVYGWESPEAEGTWASGRESWIVLAVPAGEHALALRATGPRSRGRPQRLRIERPREGPMEFAFSGELWEYETVVIPFRSDGSLTVLKLFPAHLWLPGHGDVRQCSVFVASLRLEPRP